MTYDPFVGQKRAARITAQNYRQIAQDLQLQAANYEARANEAEGFAERVHRQRSLHKKLMAAIEAQRSRLANCPFTIPAREFDISVTAAKRFYASQLREQRERERRFRNAQIMKMYERGRTNGQIAAKFKMHPVSIQRIISAERRKCS